MIFLPKNQRQYWTERIILALITIILQVIAIVLIVRK